MMKRSGMLALLAVGTVALPQSSLAESAVAWTDLSAALETATPTPMPGDMISVKLTLSNDGDFSSKEATITLLIPSGLTFINAIAAGGSYDPDQALWTVGDLPSFDTLDLQIALAVDSDASDTLTLVAEVQSTSGSFGSYDPDSTAGNGDPCEDDYDSLVLQIVGGQSFDAGPGSDADPCAQPPRPDAGVGGNDAGSQDSGMSDEGASSTGCTVADSRSQGWPLFALGLLLCWRRRRRAA